jgi:hypothetical protein
MSLKTKKFHLNIFKELLGEKYSEGFNFNSNVLTRTQKYKTKKSHFYQGCSGFNYYSGGFNSSYKYSEQNQFCVFRAKHRYDKILNKKHFDYIQRKGRGVNGSTPELYGADPDNYENRMSKLHFRWFISPENQNIDVKLLTEEFIRRIEWEKGLRLDWVAADHYNTGIKHSHVLINGFDLDRKKVQFDREELSNIYRETLRDICTDMVGYRTLEERQAAYQKQTTSNTYTQLDRQLYNNIIEKDFISLNELSRLKNNELLHKRLLYLKDLNLVSYNSSSNRFIFKENWKDLLNIYTKYNTYLEGLYFTKAHPSHYSLHDINYLGPVKGKIVKKYFMQENSK